MAIVQISKIIHRTGANIDLPQLDTGEIGFASDKNLVYIGNDTVLFPPDLSGPSLTQVLTNSANCYINGSQLVGNVEVDSVTASSFVGDGSLLTNVGALTAGTVVASSQPTITTVGTLTNLNVAGNAVINGNLVVNGTTTSINSTVVNVGDLAVALANGATTAAQANGGGIIINGASANMLYINTSNSFVFSHKITADGALLSNIPGANVTGAVAHATSANSVAGANVSGAVAYATTANAVAGANVSGAVAFATTANSVAGANVSGEVGHAAVANSVDVSNVVGIGNIATTNFTGSSSTVLYGNGVWAGLSGAGGGYSDGDVSLFLPTYTGTLGLVNLVGNALTVINGSGNNLSNIQGANVLGTVASATSAATATTAGTVTTAAQPNITSVGTLTSLHSTGDANLGNSVTANYIIGNGFNITHILGTEVSGEVANAAYANGVAGANVSGQVSYAAVANSVAGANVTGVVAYATNANTVAGGNVTGAVAYATTANSVAGGNVSGAVAYATTANSVAAGNISGTISFATSSTTAGTVTTSSQPNIVSIGTMTGLVIGNSLAEAHTDIFKLQSSNNNLYMSTASIGTTILSKPNGAGSGLLIADTGNLVSFMAGNGTGVATETLRVTAGNVYPFSNVTPAYNGGQYLGQDAARWLAMYTFYLFGTHVSAQTVLQHPVYGTPVLRDTGIPSPAAGMTIFLSSTQKFQGYNGSSWVDLN
jgi:hypothetical protein